MDGQDIQEVKLSELEFSLRIDAEYYKPLYIQLEKRLSSRKHAPLGEKSNFLIGPFGSSFTVDNYLEDSPYRYIRGRDVKPFFLQDENAFMPQEDYFRLDKYALQKDDVLVSVVGTLGNAAIVTEEALPAIFSCKSTVLRAKELRPRYLLAYLNTKLGRALLLRKTRGTVQTGLNLDDLKSLLIFVPENVFQKQIEHVVSTSEQKIQESKNLYQEAENILLEHLGLKDWQPSEAGVSVKSFADSFGTSARLDAEHYQPKYDELLGKLGSLESVSLGNLVSIKKSFEPGSEAYQEEGVPFIRIADLTKFGITSPDIHVSENIIDNLEALKLKKDTVLLTKDGSIGIAYKVPEDLNAVTSGGILHLTVRNQKVLPDYLALVLNSVVTKLQAERDAGGSIIQHWKPSEIAEVLIPILDKDVQEKIVENVHKSFDAREKSERLLGIAKRGVELAIEESEAAALAWIETQLTELGVDLPTVE